jgi:hypothetical protein
MLSEIRQALKTSVACFPSYVEVNKVDFTEAKSRMMATRG